MVLGQRSFWCRRSPELYDLGFRRSLGLLGRQIVPGEPGMAVLHREAHDAGAVTRAVVLRQNLAGRAALLVLRRTGDGRWAEQQKKTTTFC